MKSTTLSIIQAAINSYDLLSFDEKATVIFTTQEDMKVDDKICMPLAGNEYEIDDPKRPLIPEGTHPNCRCYYVDAQTGDVVTDISSPRTYEKTEDVNPIKLPQKKKSFFERILKRLRSIL